MTQICSMCGATFHGTRSEARRARWEPYSTQTQHALDYGPMVCGPCVLATIEDCLAAMRLLAGPRVRTGSHSA